MLTLNKYQTTKNGDYVFPVSVSGDVVQCFNAQGDAVYKNINDFHEQPTPESQNIEKEVVEVSPVEGKNTDQLHNESEDQPDDGLREDEDNNTSDTSSDSGYVSDDNYI
jgi:hypothetical protein